MKRKWTDEEIDFLKENIGFSKIASLAKRLNRTETAVLLKLKRLGLSNTKSFSGQLTMSELARLLKVDANTIKLWVKNHGCPCVKRVTRATRKFHFINPEDFWNWAYYNKERIDFSKIQRHSIVPEPNWVEQERLLKRNSSYKYWTTTEIKRMVDLINRGETFFEIAEKLNRSPVSVQRKFQRIAE